MDMDLENFDHEVNVRTKQDLRKFHDEIRRDPSLKSDPKRLRAKMLEADKHLDRVRDTATGLIDAHIFQDLAAMCRSQVEGINLNEEKFSADKFAISLANKMGVTLNLDEELVQRQQPGNKKNKKMIKESDAMTAEHWIRFGKLKTARFFPRAPVLEYLNSSLPDEVIDEVKLAKNQQRRHSSVKISKGAPTKVSKSISSSKDDNVDKLVKHVLRTLESVLRRKETIGFYEFVLDPESFGRTVENAFHLSFLVRERKVGIKVESEKNEDLNIFLTSKLSENEQPNSDQLIVSMSMKEWKENVERLKLKKAMIPILSESESAAGRKQVKK